MSDSDKAVRAIEIKQQNPDWGYIRIGNEIGWHKDKVRRAIEHAERRSNVSAVLVTEQTALSYYDAACRALAAAKAIDEVKKIRDESEALRAYAHIAQNYQAEADLVVIVERAERKIGEILIKAKAAGQISRGQPPKNCNESEQFPRVRLADLDISRPLSMRAQKKAGIAERAFEAMVERRRAAILNGERRGDVLKDVNAEDKQAKRASRERVLGGLQCALPTEKFGVILADPEWRFEPWSRASGMDRAADNHYPTSATEVIAARDVPSIAAEDCILFLWATVPMLPQALLVMGAWGFDYRSHFVWAKDRLGTGYWNRNKHELLLLGVRGKVPAPAMGTQWESVIAADVGEHSAKPETFVELIEFYFPSLPKIELNRRGPARIGWAAWGNESVDPETGEVVEDITSLEAIP